MKKMGRQCYCSISFFKQTFDQFLLELITRKYHHFRGPEAAEKKI